MAPVALSVTLERDAVVGSVWTSRKTMAIVASVLMFALLVRSVHLGFVTMPKYIFPMSSNNQSLCKPVK